MISTLVVINMPAFAAGQGFDSGVARFAAALRMIRAEAVTRGRQMQLTFDDQGQPQVMWQPDPLAAPGQFQPFTVSTWADSLPVDQFRVSDVRRDTLTRDQVMNILAGGGGKDPSQAVSLPAINFYPDGSTDAATFTLVPIDPQDLRQATVTLYAATGRVSSQITTVPQEPNS